MKNVIEILAIAILFLGSNLMAQEQGWGSVSGRIVVEGTPPVMPDLVAKGAAVCAVKAIPDESVIVGKNGGLKNCFVYLCQRRGMPQIHPDLKKSARKKIELKIEGCRYVPHALIVRTDQLINCFSNDIFEHSLHTFPLRNDGMNLLMPAQILRNRHQNNIELKFSLAEPLPMTVSCDLHPWMSARLFVVNHPYAVLTDENGNFMIKNLPAKTVTLRIWHEIPGYIKMNGERDIELNVPDGNTVSLGTINILATKLTP